jgi:DNA-binding Lrp family transcriptional regulator
MKIKNGNNMSENPEQKILRNQLLNLFYSNSRYSSEEIAELLNKSRQTISKIRQDLWLKKIISTPTLLLNPHSLNLQYFFMEIKTNPAEPQLLEYFEKNSEYSEY